MREICLYHAGCPDGFGAAWAARHSWGDDARYIARRHEDSLCADEYAGDWVVYLDIAPGNDELLAIARERVPAARFHAGNMMNFDLGRKYDVVTCLFSSIGYARTTEELHRAVDCMARHVAPGGLLVVEPWFSPDTWREGHLHAIQVDEPDLKISRMNVSRTEGRLSIVEFHYLIGTPDGIDHCTERHELGLFENHEYQAAFDAAGLETQFEPHGLTGRSLWIGVAPEPS